MKHTSIHMNAVCRNSFGRGRGGGGGGWSQIKPITFGNELRTYDKIPKVTSRSPVSLFLSLSLSLSLSPHAQY